MEMIFNCCLLVAEPDVPAVRCDCGRKTTDGMVYIQEVEQLIGDIVPSVW